MKLCLIFCCFYISYRCLVWDEKKKKKRNNNSNKCWSKINMYEYS